MPNIHLFLVRHGESVSNVARQFTGWMDAALTAQGKKQAKATGKVLKANAPFDLVYTSDLLRACDTAWLIAEQIGFSRENVKLCRDLRERSPGILTGLEFEEAKEKYPDIWENLLKRDWNFTCPEGESNDTVSKRVSTVLEKAIDQVKTKDKSSRVLFVSHGVAIAHILRIALSIEKESFPRKIMFHTENAAYHHLILRDDQSWIAKALNVSSHLLHLGEH